MSEQKVKLFNSLEEGKGIIPNGHKRLVKIGDRNICVVSAGSSFIAFQNECPHLGHPLHDGTINPYGEIVCALHSYRFDLNTGEECNFRCPALRFYKITEEPEGVMIVI